MCAAMAQIGSVNRSSDGSVRRLDLPVSMPRESTAIRRVNRGLVGPRPPTEPRASVIRVSLAELLLGAHDEGTVLCNRFTNRAALKQQ